ncbi:unnamed protein product [Symbiodinium pilosum]|uniref:Uncharacterized protein n=1 Tax=Symbiodinium pilosum TaxID=2952 RepID=A0A812VWP6_SYMPI|nr:unnamed protein product [Symbiodinium pilosum]
MFSQCRRIPTCVGSRCAHAEQQDQPSRGNLAFAVRNTIQWSRLPAAKSLAGSMSIDSVLRGASLELRVQEKARNRNKRGIYCVDLSRHGGRLGKLAYRSADFDALVSTVLDELKVAGLFMFPTKVLERHALVDQKPVSLQLYPPWALPKRESARMKHAWQLDHFVDLRDWKGGDALPSCCRDRLLDLLQGFED